MTPRAVPSEALTSEPSAELSTPDLLREVVDESKELVRLEIRLAQEELRDDVRKLPLERTRTRLATDVRALKEQVT